MYELVEVIEKMRLENYTMKHNGMYILKKTDFDEIADMVLKE